MTTIHWLMQTEADVPTDNDWLSASEAAILAHLHVAKRHDEWRLGRWTAKRALVAYLGQGPDRWPMAMIEIRATPDGAPEAFFNARPAPVTISLSHRAGRALCAVAPAAVALGCDLEVIEPRSEVFIADYFIPEERAFIERAPEDDRPQLITLFWSAKESALKALRVGLRLDTRSVVMNLPPSPPTDGWGPLAVQAVDAGRTFRGWWRHKGAYLLTVVAAPPPPPPIALSDWI
jgi:4'-phosphopantetheinyl transferase